VPTRKIKGLRFHTVTPFAFCDHFETGDPKIAFFNRPARAGGLVSERLQLSDAARLTARVNRFGRRTSKKGFSG
jgi:hypothetical protein